MSLIVLVIAISYLTKIYQNNHQEETGSHKTFIDHLGDNAVYVVTVIASQGT
jgi:hypothetical protein